MALVEHILVAASFNNGETCVEIKTQIDDSEIDIDGVPFPDATFQDDIVGSVIGPGSFDVFVWRKGGHAAGRNPWREIEGVTEADGELRYAPGGPVQDMGDIDTIELKAHRRRQ